LTWTAGRRAYGYDDSRYVEAHLHGKLTPDDVLSYTAA
jgi:hypothetical protein